MANFFDPHRGIQGATKRLPTAVSFIAEDWNGKQGDVAVLLDELRRVFPDGLFEDRPGKADTSPLGLVEGFISLRYPAKGIPCDAWRVIRYRTHKGSSR
jgi:hypothetical protein